MPAPALTQLISSLGVAKIMWFVEILVTVSWAALTLTSMLKPLKLGILDTLIQKLTCTPFATTAWLAGATKTVGVVDACAGGKANEDNANTTINAVTRTTAAIGSPKFLPVLLSCNDRV